MAKLTAWSAAWEKLLLVACLASRYMSFWPWDCMRTVIKQDGDYMKCLCKICEHTMRKDCVLNGCKCCDLEDMFSMLSKTSFR